MKSILLYILFSFCGSISFCQTQATATFTASVHIIEPIGITTTSNMNFASLDAKSGGSVILTPENERIISGGLELADGATVSAASFKVTGENGYSFSITLPKGEYLLSDGSETVIIRDFTSNYSEAEFSASTPEIKVGATLDIEAGQKPGNYKTLTAIPVTVNYN